MKIRIFVVALVMILLQIQCKKNPFAFYPITVSNKADYDIYFDYATGGIGGVEYPDTSIAQKKMFQKVVSGSYISWSYSYPLDEIINRLKNDTLSFYFIHADTLESVDWDTITKYYLILDRYDLSADDVELLHNRIYYPPTDKMKDMKIWSRRK